MHKPRSTKPGNTLPLPAVLAGKAILSDVVGRVVARTLALCEASDRRLEEILFETVYQEERRFARAEPNARTPADQEFIAFVRRGLAREDEAGRERLLHAVVLRYAREISGVFDTRVYRFATRVLPSALAFLMHGGRPGPDLFRVEDRVLVEGELAALRAAMELGTVVLVPTHVSNLDSLLLGYAISALGLTPYAYGAGLNLFSNPLTGFFMRHLGAFTVDRQKTDPLYLATVKEYTTVLLERGQHTLFFPGGTRSRAGSIESHLKLGFLGCAITAYGNLQRAASSRPIFIVPCTLSYPLALEAESLIGEYLRSEGGPQYVELRDEFDHPARWYDFLRGLSQLDLQVHLRFGQPLDILGHPVDVDGTSHGPGDHALDPADYLRVNGEVTDDPLRDAEYTRILAERIMQSYRGLAVALPSSVLAFVVFERLRKRSPQRDIFRLLRALGVHASVPLEEVTADVETLLAALRQQDELKLAPELCNGSASDVIARGIATLSSYHRAPVLSAHAASLQVGNPALLFYYRNRLDGYGLLGAPGLSELFGHSTGRRSV